MSAAKQSPAARPDVFTSAEKLTAIERELSYRRRVYPRMIAEDKMSAGAAQRQIAIFEQIAEDYAELARKECLL